MFTPVGNLLGRLPRRSKLSGAINALLVIRAFDEVLVQVCQDLPKTKIGAVHAKSFKDGVLEVQCAGLMVSELSMRSGELIRALNSRLGKKIIVRVKFKS
ncbi:DUF721 domain-containing protein [Candidatus Curtissbacteria bacterium]|nr:DUF721 domain-containing protein [Candidatus Curtissbacteria bacterium]